jgi:hypothetical protein
MWETLRHLLLSLIANGQNLGTFVDVIISTAVLEEGCQFQIKRRQVQNLGRVSGVYVLM